ncbi:hypothetical protein HHK36_006082 [Tetracentron sinense]|uniref:Pentatricopeptide repeat-containing protein n=1 Tax=Tetracentron sinense TaxID=13715 RepID=A0A834ZHF3_TETSI|nr:hypothetical protein HHK36_006082 [Tetracentron sinense]
MDSYTFPFLLREQIHLHVLKLGLESDAFVHTLLINMNAPTGELTDARMVFDKMSLRDAVSFMDLITGSGLSIFDSLIQDYKISPKVQHYEYMMDIIGRAGLFDEAESLMKNMKMKPNGAIWGYLLGACQVLLSNIYAGAGRWDDVARIRTRLNGLGMKKMPGCSSIEVDSIVHEFLVGDKAHALSKEIYNMLDEIDEMLKLAGHVPDNQRKSTQKLIEETLIGVLSSSLGGEVAFGLPSKEMEITGSGAVDTVPYVKPVYFAVF